MAQEAQPEQRHRGAPSPFFLLRWGKRARAIGALGTFLSNPASLAILVPVGLFILALFMLLFATGFTGPGAPVLPGPQPTVTPGRGTPYPTYPFPTNVTVTGVSPGTNFAIQLVNNIGASCEGVVNINNVNCLNAIIPPLVLAVLQQIQYSVLNVPGGVLQCVGFVQAVITGITGQQLDRGGHAYQFATYVPTGYRFISKNEGVTVQEGDLPIWDATGESPWGHIAYITKVIYNNDYIEVAESNFDRLPGAGGRAWTRGFYISSSPNLLGWLRKL